MRKTQFDRSRALYVMAGICMTVTIALTLAFSMYWSGK
jgi:hypothetical protein